MCPPGEADAYTVLQATEPAVETFTYGSEDRILLELNLVVEGEVGRILDSSHAE
jgi:hypothetical protein